MSALSAEHKDLKEALLALLKEVVDLAEETGMHTLAGDLRDTRIPKLLEERFSLVVLGEFNHGKSTFVNALLGAPILPAGITPTTATINHLIYAEAPYAHAVMLDGATLPIDLGPQGSRPQALSDWVTIEGKNADKVRYVEVGWPAELLRDRVTLVDTPGVNDINEARAEITYNYVPRADAVLFLLDGAQVLKQSERAFLEQRILRRSKDKLIFIIGKVDLLAPDEKEEALRYCRGHLQRLLDTPVLFALSAKQALAGKLDESGLVPLLHYLSRYLSEERGRVLLDNASGDGQRLASYLRQNLGIKRRSLHLGLEELEARIARVRGELSGKQQTLRQVHQRIAAEAEAVKAKIRLDLEEFSAAFAAALPEEIDRADPADVRKYLQPFLQDTLKTWAEQEGEHVSALLERLAEEIIQITNENVKEAMALVSAELGPADTQVELTVDTLKYDLGVFALGALGAGIFVFVNMLVGGALALAAPFLALLIHGRVADKIKSQAREQAPGVVRQALEALQPRFLQIADDFATRLSDFVTAAGQALHQGISEMLDRALEERRAQGLDVEARDRDIQAQMDRLRTIEERLSDLRQRLWLSSTGSTASPPSSAN